MEVKSIYPIINFSDDDEIAVQYERLGADGAWHHPDFCCKLRNVCKD